MYFFDRQLLKLQDNKRLAGQCQAAQASKTAIQMESHSGHKETPAATGCS